MKRFMIAAGVLFSLSLGAMLSAITNWGTPTPAYAQTCNSPSGFLQSIGPFPIGHIAILGPDCNHLQDGGIGSVIPSLPTGDIYVGNAGNPIAQAMSQDCTMAVNGAITCTKSNNVPIRIPQGSSPTLYVNGNSSSTAACGPTGASTCSAGSDSNNCLSPGAACLTVQHAVNVILQSIDLAGFNVTVSLAHGSSANYGGVLCNTPVVGRPTIFIQGDTTNAAAVTAVAPNGLYAFYALDFCALRIDSITIADQGMALQGVRIGQDGIIDFVNAHCAAFNSSAQCIFMEKSSSANLGSAASITIDGCGAEFLKMIGGTFNVGGVLSPPASVPSGAISISNALACSDALVNASGNSILQSFAANTFSGTGVAGTTGVRAKLSGSAYLFASGSSCNTVFPGNSPCQLSQSAQDDALDPLTTPVPIASGGTGITLGSPRIVGPATNVNFGVAGDNSISVPLPSGYTQLCLLQLYISGANGNLTTATYGVFTATGGGGTAIIAAGAAITVTNGTPNTNNNFQQINPATVATEAFTPTGGVIYWRVGATVAQTGNVQASYIPCP